MTDKFICRGIRKDNGEFCFGYAIFVPVCHRNNGWFIKLTDGGHFGGLVEITQEPDRWTETFDFDKNRIWCRDIVRNVAEHLDTPNSIIISGCSENVLLGAYEANYMGKKFDTKSLMQSDNVKVIGSIHFNKELLEEGNEEV